jgi:molecular chaperone GrpE|tara:strand:- start:55 stop:558 length:504 start_codon:yes stop_codon:yes gene_type:complete
MTKKKQDKPAEEQPKDTTSVDDSTQRIDELTLDLQRTRADFENYRKRVEQEKQMARMTGEATAVAKLLPVIDNIERAIMHVPQELADNKWAQGIVGLVKNLEKSLDSMNLQRIDAKPGTAFDPERHEAIQMDEDAEGEQEVIAEELQAGYTLHGKPLRSAMVKVTRK